MHDHFYLNNYLRHIFVWLDDIEYILDNFLVFVYVSVMDHRFLDQSCLLISFLCECMNVEDDVEGGEGK